MGYVQKKDAAQFYVKMTDPKGKKCQIWEIRERVVMKTKYIIKEKELHHNINLMIPIGENL